MSIKKNKEKESEGRREVTKSTRIYYPMSNNNKNIKVNRDQCLYTSNENK